MRSFLLFLACSALPQTSFAQNNGWKFQKTLDSLLATKDPGAGNPGFAVCIVEHGKIVYERQFGMASLELKRPIVPETMFNIGSVTKQFTAACILLLEEQGKLHRSDPVQKFIPELPDFGQTITLDHLISHTSGLHDHLEVLGLKSAFKNSRLEASTVFSFYQKSPVLASLPGTNFAYNNTGYMLLNIVIERVSGMKTGDFMQKNIFQPLGMAHSNFHLEEPEGLTDGTVSYTFNADKKRYKKTKAIHNALGATGVHCTLRDLVLWQINFEQNKLGKSGLDFIRKMETAYTLNDGSPVHYGAGLVLKNYRGIPTVEHGGGWNSFLLQCRRFPEQDISILVASNNDHSSPFPIADAICDKLFVFKSFPEKFASNLSVLPLSPENLTGKYLSFNNRLRNVLLDGDTLKITLAEAPKKRPVYLRFDPAASSDTLLTFRDPTSIYPVQFSISKDGAVRGFFWDGGDYFQCRRFFETLKNTNQSVATWAGKYRAKDFNQKIRIRRKSGNLKLKPVFFLGYPLEPITDSAFKVKDEDIILRFSEGSFILGDDWVSNLKFLK